MARKTETSDPASHKRLPEPKLHNDEVSLSELLDLINDARTHVLEARKMDEPVLSFERVRASLREAYFTLGGEQSDLARNTSLESRRMFPYMLVHLAAHNLQMLAAGILDDGESPERAFELLHRSRDLTRIIQRHLFGQRPSDDGGNVIDLGSRKSRRRNAS